MRSGDCWQTNHDVLSSMNANAVCDWCNNEHLIWVKHFHKKYNISCRSSPARHVLSSTAFALWIQLAALKSQNPRATLQKLCSMFPAQVRLRYSVRTNCLQSCLESRGPHYLKPGQFYTQLVQISDVRVLKRINPDLSHSIVSRWSPFTLWWSFVTCLI